MSQLELALVVHVYYFELVEVFLFFVLLCSFAVCKIVHVGTDSLVSDSVPDEGLEGEAILSDDVVTHWDESPEFDFA